MTGLVSLRIRGGTVLGVVPVGLTGSAVAFARAAIDGHRVGDGWPLFATADFSVTLRDRDVELGDFERCEVPRASRFVVPWDAFAAAAVRMGDIVVRRANTPDPALSESDLALRAEWRAELRTRLRTIRARRRELDHRRPRGDR